MIDDSMRSPNTQSNTRITTANDIRRIFEKAYQGGFQAMNFIEEGKFVAWWQTTSGIR
ncbi:hypothetical protein ACM6Q7_14220 [Peribacillus butanolivorans]